MLARSCDVSRPGLPFERCRCCAAGHTSWSTTGLGYLSLWAAGKLRAFDTQRGGQPWRLVAALLPLALAVYVGLTRIIDYWCAVKNR
jgi:diacylglycerol diphosphate phosphatase / phosphatidate phosphatase